MNKRTLICLPAIIFGWFFILAGMSGPVTAQEGIFNIGHNDIFGKLQRPAVTFPHDQHVDAMEDDGCGACHHVYDDGKGALVPAHDGEEMSCTECHGARKDGSTPALREAYHGQCTGCHRRLAGENKTAGPVTCGECHKK